MDKNKQGEEKEAWLDKSPEAGGGVGWLQEMRKGEVLEADTAHRVRESLKE